MKENEFIGFEKVELSTGFWKNRYDLNALSSIPSIIKTFEPNRFEAIKLNYGNTGIMPHVFYDSDVAKTIEAISFLLNKDRSKYKHFESLCDTLINEMKKNAAPSGYFNSYFQQLEKDQVFKQRISHELYCLGHLIEAAIAYSKSTGKDDLLDVCTKYLDYVNSRFIIKKDTDFVTPGHEEIELALLKLYEFTGKKKYFRMSAFFLENRGRNDKDSTYEVCSNRYAQDNAPIRELKLVEGHAVRAMYLYIAMAKYAKLKNDKELIKTLEVLYEDLTKKVYITGGIGSAKMGEAFTIPYDLPNLTAYSESCAAIGLIWYLMGLFELCSKKEYSDLIERTLYNVFLSSTSIDGKAFFYENPLEICHKEINKETATNPNNRQKLPITERQELFGCSCCPPNIARLVASIGGLIYSKNLKNIYINQFISSSMSINATEIEMKSGFPKEFKVEIKIKSISLEKEVLVRIPEWALGFDIQGSGFDYRKKKGYISIVAKEKNVVITISFVTKPVFIESNPEISDNVNKLCLMYGPICYCLESIDNGENLSALLVKKNCRFEIEYNDYFQMNVIKVIGYRRLVSNKTYAQTYKVIEQLLTFIPYYGFSNRGQSDMKVWVNKY